MRSRTIRPATLPPYTYTALDHNRSITRLVKLLPAAHTRDPIRCEIIEALVDKTRGVPYEALSYCWGSSNVTLDIQVVGIASLRTPESMSLSVTTNLYAALQALRYRDKTRLLWIDAISINQKNLHERNHQVQRMLNIYREAQSVIVWLGRSLSPDDGQLNLAQVVHKISSRPWCSDNTFQNFVRYLELPWFRRVWVSTAKSCGLRPGYLLRRLHVLPLLATIAIEFTTDLS